MLDINNLSAKVDKKTILDGLTLKIKPGEVHALWVLMVLEKVR